MPAPMIAPSPIAVSCHSPMLRSSPCSSSLPSIGLRRKIPLRLHRTRILRLLSHLASSI